MARYLEKVGDSDVSHRWSRIIDVSVVKSLVSAGRSQRWPRRIDNSTSSVVLSFECLWRLAVLLSHRPWYLQKIFKKYKRWEARLIILKSAVLWLSNLILKRTILWLWLIGWILASPVTETVAVIGWILVSADWLEFGVFWDGRKERCLVGVCACTSERSSNYSLQPQMRSPSQRYLYEIPLCQNMTKGRFMVEAAHEWRLMCDRCKKYLVPQALSDKLCPAKNCLGRGRATRTRCSPDQKSLCQVNLCL